MDEQQRLLRGVARGALWLLAGGGVLLGALGRWDWTLGFTIGGGISFGNFLLLAHAVARGHGQGELRPARVLRGSLARLGLTGLVLFLVLVYLPVNVIALALGLLVVQVVVVGGAVRRGFQVGAD